MTPSARFIFASAHRDRREPCASRATFSSMWTGRTGSRACGSSAFLHFRKASDHHHRPDQGRPEAYSGSGEWDLVAIVKVAEYEQIAQVVTERFPEVSAIERTQTLTAFRAYSKKDLEQAWDIGVE